MSDPIPTPKLQDLRKAAERLGDRWISDTNNPSADLIDAVAEYNRQTDPSTILALVDELLERRGDDCRKTNQPRSD